MILSEKQQALFDYVKHKHREQKRKYTDVPYHTHLFNVAEIVSEYENDCVEIALCHDLFEDTSCNFTELYKKMVDIGYGRDFAYDTCTAVTELTDKYTSKDFPYLNRAKRKAEESKRLATLGYKSQSVKYADLIDNTSSIVEYDKDFASVYLPEKEQILKVMNKGNAHLYELCRNLLNKVQLPV